MAKWYKINARADAIDISIFTDIGFGYTASDFQRDLKAAGDSKPINLRLNSPGGDVFTGWAIFNILSRVRDRVTVTVEGLAASMASVIAMAGKTIIMPENAMMMIHDPAGGAFGGPEEIANFADALNKIRDQIIKTYSDRTGQNEEDIRAMMSAETWLSASEAVNLGFADKIEKPIQMAARAGFDLRCFKNVPSSFGTPTQEEVNMNEEIKRICALFGKADLAAGFIEAKKSVADVLTALEAAKAEDDKKAKDAADAAAAVTAANANNDAPNAETIRNQVLDEVAEINSLCALAGKPQLATGFIKERKSVKAVIAALAEAKAADAESSRGKGKGAKTDASGEVSAHHVPHPTGEGSAKELDPLKVWNKFNSAGKKSA